jgi:imidazolonepropionase-like amidohydrolase
MKVAFGENPKVNFNGQSKSPVTRMAIAALLRQELFEAKQYLENDEPFDFQKECWRPVFEGKIPLKAHAHRADDIQTAIRIAKEFGLGMTLDHCSEGHFITEVIKESGFPAIVGPDLASRNKIEVKNMAFKTAGILAKGGVMVAITTDHPVSQIASLPFCAALAVKNGMPMEEGLKAITINAAKICRVEKWVGSLTPGKYADIVIYKGHPMDLFSKVAMTMIKGEIVYK